MRKKIQHAKATRSVVSTDAKEAAKNVGALAAVQRCPWFRYQKLKRERAGNCMRKSYSAVYLLTSLQQRKQKRGKKPF